MDVERSIHITKKKKKREILSNIEILRAIDVLLGREKVFFYVRMIPLLPCNALTYTGKMAILKIKISIL